MGIDELDNSAHFRLSRVLRVLESLYGLTIDFSAANNVEELEAVHEAYGNMRRQIISEAHHNSYHANPDYAKACLIQEAIGIFLSEVAPKRRRRKNNHA